MPQRWFESLESRQFMSAGSLDTGFGEGGVVSEPLPASDAVVQRDGNIVTAGSTGGACYVARFLANGQLDPAFGSKGVGTFPIAGGASPCQPTILTDGSIDVSTPSGVLHLTPQGTIDPAFGPTGIVQTSGLVDPRGGYISVVQQQLPRTQDQSLGSSQVVVTRQNPDGSLDTSYGTNGSAIIPLSSNWSPSTVTGSGINADGSVFILGFSATQMQQGAFAYRADPSGAVSSIEPPGKTSELPTDPTGRFIQAAHGEMIGTIPASRGANAVLALYEADGSINLNYGTSLYSSTTPVSSVVGQFLAADDYGQIITTDGHGNVSRYMRSGYLDTQFGAGGSINVGTQTIRQAVFDGGDMILVGVDASSHLRLTAVDDTYTSIAFDGMLYQDHNADGYPDSGDEGLGYRDVSLESAASEGIAPAIYSTETDANGHFSFPAVPAGKYSVVISLNAGEQITTPQYMTVKLTAGAGEGVDIGISEPVRTRGPQSNPHKHRRRRVRTARAVATDSRLSVPSA